jgi:poly-gamma-glutamate capsule biosynthesis protein CapA/YwtB (metallophosphatase superfamily)
MRINFFLIALVIHIIFPFSTSASNETKITEKDTIKVFSNFSSIMEAKHKKLENIYFSPESLGLKDVLLTNIIFPPQRIKIMAVGDIMPGTNYPSESYLPSSCGALFDPVRQLIQSADVAIGNLEGVFSSAGGVPKNCSNPKNCYVFRMPDSYANCIKEAGFDILGVANNHVNDFGYEGRLNTAGLLEREGIPFAGFSNKPYLVYHVAGIRIGFCAFAPHTGTLNFKDYENAAAIVEELKMKSDLVIVSFHAGAEGKDHQHVTRKDEVFLGHNRGNPWYFAHRVIDAGADLVIGHGPHVVRAIEFYKEKLIAYSLGNFCTYSRFNLSGPNALAPVLEVELDREGNYISGRIHSFQQLGEGGPVPDISQRAMKRIRELSLMDFPEKKILIDEKGFILNTNKIEKN